MEKFKIFESRKFVDEYGNLIPGGVEAEPLGLVCTVEKCKQTNGDWYLNFIVWLFDCGKKQEPIFLCSKHNRGYKLVSQNYGLKLKK